MEAAAVIDIEATCLGRRQDVHATEIAAVLARDGRRPDDARATQRLWMAMQHEPQHRLGRCLARHPTWPSSRKD